MTCLKCKTAIHRSGKCQQCRQRECSRCKKLVAPYKDVAKGKFICGYCATLARMNNKRASGMMCEA